jgi:SET domain
MNLVPLWSGPSKIHGTGCFTGVELLEGTIAATLLDKAQIKNETELPQNKTQISPMRFYGDLWMLLEKDEKNAVNYINHSGAPNCLLFLGVIIAKQKIPAGKELSLDYRLFDPKFSKSRAWCEQVKQLIALKPYFYKAS